MTSAPKPTPVVSLPDNWSGFNGYEVLPWEISRADAASTLRQVRIQRSCGQANVRVEAVGRYRLSSLNTIILTTRQC